MPDISDAQYLVDWMEELGWRGSPAPNYITALSNQEIESFFRLRRIEPEPWEVHLMVRASKSYIGGWNLGLDEAAYSPMELQGGS